MIWATACSVNGNRLADVGYKYFLQFWSNEAHDNEKNLFPQIFPERDPALWMRKVIGSLQRAGLFAKRSVY